VGFSSQEKEENRKAKRTLETGFNSNQIGITEKKKEEWLSFSNAENKEKSEVTQSEQEKAENDFRQIKNPKILVIGDSIGFGFGDDENEGIGNRYAKLTNNDMTENPVNNISVSGDEVSDLEIIISNKDWVEPIIIGDCCG
jgi:hypothetical protein